VTVLLLTSRINLISTCGCDQYKSLSSDVDALANISCEEMSPNDCSNETEDIAEATTFEEEEGAENERRDSKD